MKVQTLTTCLRVFKAAGTGKFPLFFRDIAILPTIMAPFEEMITFEVLEEIETFVPV